MGGVVPWLWPGHGLAPLLFSQVLSRWHTQTGTRFTAGTDENARPPEKRSLYRRPRLRKNCQRSKGHGPGLFAFPHKLISGWLRPSLMGVSLLVQPPPLETFLRGTQQWMVVLLSSKPALTVIRKHPAIGIVHPAPSLTMEPFKKTILNVLVETPS